MLTPSTYTASKSRQGFTGVVYSCGSMTASSTETIIGKQAHNLPVARPENLDWTRPGP